MGSAKRLLRGFFIVVAAGLAGYVTWDRVEVYRLDRDIKEIAARGEPIDLSAAVPVPSNAQEQEAAQLYADAAERARQMLERDSRLTRVDVDAASGPFDIAEIAETFRPDAPALQLLDRATPLPFNGFGDVLDGPEWTAGSAIQSLNLLACLRSDLLAYHGDGDAAVASLVAAVRLQRTQPNLLARNILATRQFGSLRVLLRHSAPSTRGLEALEQAVAELPDDDMMQRDLMLRRARLIEAHEPALGQPGVPALVLVGLHPFLVRAERVQLEQFPQVMLAARAPWPDKLGILSALAESAGNRANRPSPIRAILEPPINIAALAAAPAQAGSRLAIRRLMLTTMAIERYRRAHGGAPPVDLKALVPAYLAAVPLDPFSGQPLVYRLSTTDYVLYSADVNSRDDGGQFYGFGAQNTTWNMRMRDLGLRVPLTPRRAAQ